LSDISGELLHPLRGQAIHDLYNDLPVDQHEQVIRVVPYITRLPGGEEREGLISFNAQNPMIFGILNVTPDRHHSNCRLQVYQYELFLS
jgi:hypothetical protein